MYQRKGSKKKLQISILYLFIPLIFISLRPAKAQNWVAMPPYNTLWPLWSPALSPINNTTGLPTPVVTSLKPSTVLPVQPGLTWNPVLNYPWLLYNTPAGMVYYDPLGGIDLWPPALFTNQITGLPIILTLPANYSTLLPTPVWWIINNVATANWSYLVAYPSYAATIAGANLTIPAPTITSLLTGALLL